MAITNEYPGNECVICYEVTTDRLRCLHVVCHMCHEKWFEEHSTCPLCRQSIEVDNDETSYTSLNEIRFRNLRDRFIMSEEEISVHTVSHMPRFDVWLVNQILFENPIFPINQFGYFLKMKSLPFCYQYNLCEYGLKVVGKNDSRLSRGLRMMMSDSWNIGDIIAYIDGVLFNEANIAEFTSRCRYTTCHILNPNIFGDLNTLSTP